MTQKVGQEAVVEVIVNSRELAQKLSKTMEGSDINECCAALGIALALVCVDEDMHGRRVGKSLVDTAFISALATFDGSRK